MGGACAAVVGGGLFFTVYEPFRSKEDIAKGSKVAQNIAREIIINSRRLKPWIRAKIKMRW